MNPSFGHTLLDASTFTLSGDDTKRWCNGMFSNNFRSMRPNQHHRSAICDDRGRVQGFLDAICVSDTEFLCTLDGNSIEDFNGRFKMYMMLDEIELEEHGAQILHLFGEELDSVFEELSLPIPEPAQAVLHGSVWIRHRSRLRGTTGIDIISASDDTADWKSIVDRLNNRTPSTTQAQFEDFRIQTGTPRYPQDFTDKSFIHDYDLQDDVCSFNKGCYIGQEIINRMDIKKLATKKLMRVRLSGSWTVGDDLLLEDKKSGTLTSIASDGTIGLALLRKTAWEQGTNLHNGDNTAIVG